MEALHFASTWALVGLIWTIQLVHYPLFSQVGEQQFVQYVKTHGRNITWLVGPLMVAELVASYFVWKASPGALETAGLLAVAVNWLVTGALFAPLHSRLAKGFDKDLCRKLIQANWIRTALWTARGVVVFALHW